MNARLIHLKWVLVDQIVDLATATSAIRDHIEVMKKESAPSEKWSICYFRMCSTFLIVSLAKLWEALEHYGNEIRQFPNGISSECTALKKEIERKKIYQFRSKYAAHIINKKTKMPISLSEGERRYKEIVGDNIDDILDFCNWIYPENNSSESVSVMSTVIKARDHCLSIVGPCDERP